MMRFFSYLLLGLALSACNQSSSLTRPLDLPSLKGQWVLINYWAQWCSPCIKEIPELNRFDAERPDVTVLGVNYDGALGEELQTQLDKFGAAFPTLSPDPGPQLGIPRPSVLPTTVIIDPQGNVVQTLVGPQTGDSLAAALGD